jgi:uncharacterized protein (DUF1697 family)
MNAMISMLRGVNVGGHHLIKMEALRALYASLGLLDAQTYVQSGNVVFRSKEKNHSSLARKIEAAIEREFGFRPDVILRTPAEVRDAMARNPFAARKGMEPSKLLLVFLASALSTETITATRAISCEPEEMHIHERELYIYFPNGMARPKLSMSTVERAIKTSWTGRNWNTVTKLLEMAERLEG